MPRKIKDSRLETRTARLRLKVSTHPYSRMLEHGLTLLYYRSKKRGSWSVRLYIDKKYHVRKIGLADDYQQADGSSVFDFSQAQEKAREIAKKLTRRDGGPYTIKQAVDDYLSIKEGKLKTFKDIKSRLHRWVVPRFGKLLIEDLKAESIERWHKDIARTKARLRTSSSARKPNYRHGNEQDERARKVSANRELSYFKAVLNLAYKKGRIDSDIEWRGVEPFKDVNVARTDWLSKAQAAQLLNCCETDFQQLCRGALLTGCRYSELARLVVRDFYPDSETVFIEKTKSSRSRHVHLNQEGVAFFKSLTVNKRLNEPIFIKSDGEQWMRSDQTRRMNKALRKAKLQDLHITFHSLRHSYASQLINNGVSLPVVAKLMGHSSVDVTERHYGHLAAKALRDAVRNHLPGYEVDEAQSTNIEHLGK